MNIISKICLTLFEIVNELFIAAGAGVVGIAVLIKHGYRTNQLLRTLCVASISVGCLVYVSQTGGEMVQPSARRIILISGCDSGLGFSLAIHASKLGFTVIAGFLSLDSAGAKEIRQSYRSIKQIQLDITDNESIFIAVETINQYLNSNPAYEFYALINNAGIMVFGEFEWQTERLIYQQLHINMFGTMNLSKAFIPLLRKYQGRMINIISHCSHACLPGLSVYGATKAGLKAFSDGIRVELAKYGVKVVMLIPGSFVTQSNIMAKHSEHVHEMHRGLNKEQHLFYEDYFKRYNAHLLGIPVNKIPQKIRDNVLYSKFEEALLLEMPKSCYKVEPLRYMLYHSVFKFSPVPIRDYFIVKFMQMPQYNMSQIL